MTSALNANSETSLLFHFTFTRAPLIGSSADELSDLQAHSHGIRGWCAYEVRGTESETV